MCGLSVTTVVIAIFFSSDSTQTCPNPPSRPQLFQQMVLLLLGKINQKFTLTTV